MQKPFLEVGEAYRNATTAPPKDNFLRIYSTQEKEFYLRNTTDFTKKERSAWQKFFNQDLQEQTTLKQIVEEMHENILQAEVHIYSNHQWKKKTFDKNAYNSVDLAVRNFLKINDTNFYLHPETKALKMRGTTNRSDTATIKLNHVTVSEFIQDEDIIMHYIWN